MTGHSQELCDVLVQAQEAVTAYERRQADPATRSIGELLLGDPQHRPHPGLPSRVVRGYRHWRHKR